MAELTADSVPAAPLGSRLQEARIPTRPSMWASVCRQPLALTGLIIIIAFSLIALFGRYFAPYGPTEQFSKHILESPNRTYWLGTDEFGRDILTRMLYGSRVSFKVGFISVGLAGSVGVVLGLIAGYLGGWIDNILVLLMDVIWAFPAVLLAIVFITTRGNNLTNAMIAIAIVYMPTFMRVVRGATLAVRQTVYVEAAISTGVSTPRILARHVFPNVTAPLIVHASLNFAAAVLAEASLSFLGLGNKPGAVVGIDGERELRVSAASVVGSGRARYGDRAGGARFQPCRRRPPRRHGSAVAECRGGQESMNSG